MLARHLLVSATVLLALAAPTVAKDADETPPGAWYDQATDDTTLTWTHEPRTVAHVVYRDGEEVARLPPSHTTWTDPHPGSYTLYRVDSLQPDGVGRSLTFLVFVAPHQPIDPEHHVPTPDVPPVFDPPSTSDNAWRGLPFLDACPWASFALDSQPLFVRAQANPECLPNGWGLPPVFDWSGGDAIVDMDTFLD